MLESSLRRWLKRLSENPLPGGRRTTRRRNPAKQKGRPRPTLEALEERTLLSGNGYIAPALATVAQEYQQYLATAAPGQPYVSQYADAYSFQGGAIYVEAQGQGDFLSWVNGLRALHVSPTTLDPTDEIVYAYLPLNEVTAAAALPQTQALLPYFRPVQPTDSQASGTGVGQAETSLKADIARRLFNTTGSGVTVGVISDSASAAGVTRAQKSKDLPSGSRVNVLPGGAGTGVDEGLAMMELVYDIAPGVNLVFHTAEDGSGNESDQSMAAAINAEVTAGCNIIVDDINGLTFDPYLQDGKSAQAVDAAVAAGVTYLASAGNRTLGGYESVFRGTDATVAGIKGRFQNFNGGSGAADPTQLVTVPTGKTTFVFQFDDPFYVTKGVTHNVHFLLIDPKTNKVLPGGADTDNVDTTSANTPRQILTYNNQTGASQQIEVAVEVVSGGDIGLFDYLGIAPTGFPTIDSHAADGVITSINPGHNSAVGAITVAAADYQTPTTLEQFSSQGPAFRVFDASGNRLSSVQTRNKPDLTSNDDVQTEVPGDNGAFMPFFGTSAAAPDAAAVAALVLSFKNTLTPATLRSALIAGTVNITGSGQGSLRTGAGLLDATGALLSLTNGALPINGDFDSANENDSFTLAVDTNKDGVGNTVMDVTINGTELGNGDANAPADSGVRLKFVNSVAVKGEGGNNSLTIDYANGSPIPAGGLSFDGGSGNNTLTLLNQANTWQITGHNSGTADTGVTFTNVQNLTGGGQADSFVFSDGQGVDGTVDGGGGANTLDYHLYSTPITVNLQTGAATGTGGFKNIQSLVGGAGSDTLVGADTPNTWHVTSQNAGDVNGAFTFSSIENLTGGALNDSFVFSDGQGVDGTVDGGGGVNTLDYHLYSTPITVNLQTGAATGTGGFAHIQNLIGGAGSDTLVGADTPNTWHVTSQNAGDVNGAFTFSSIENLTGGALNDSFVFSNGQGVDGVVDGGGGVNTLDYHLYSTPITVNLQTAAATGTGGFAHIQNLIGGAGSDTLIGANTPNTWHITAQNAGDVNGAFTFSSIENLTGGALNDAFVFSDGMGVDGIVDGGGGVNTLDYHLYSAPHPITVNLQTDAATGTGGFANIQNLIGGAGSDKLIGANTPNIWHITAQNAGDVNGAFTFSSIENLTGGALNDAFVFSDGMGVDGIVDGGGGVNTLDYHLYAAAHPIAVNLQTAAATGTGGFAHIQNLIGGAGSDTLVGANTPNTWHITSPNKGDVNGAFTFSSIENLTGGSGADAFVFSDGASEDGRIDGMGGFDTLDFTAFTTPIGVGLTGLGAVDGFDGVTTHVGGGFANIDAVNGGQASDVFFGLNQPSVWSIDAVSRYMSGGRALIFVSFEIIVGGAATDAFFITGVSTPTAIYGGGGDDVFVVSNVTNIKAQLTVNGGGQAGDILYIDDRAGSAPRVVSFTATSVGAMPGDSFFGPGGVLYYVAFQALSFLGGPFGNTVNVHSKVPGTSMDLATGAGNDFITVYVTPDSAYANLLVNGQAGVDTLRVIDLTGTAIIHNIPAGPGAGDVFVSYLAGGRSFIDYVDVEAVVTSPGASQSYVEALFRHYDHRDGTPAELAYWTAVLDATGNRFLVVNSIARSLEAFDVLVKGWYARYYRRPAVGGEEAPYVILLLQGQPEENVLAAFLNSPEYFARAGFNDVIFVEQLYLDLVGRPPSLVEVFSYLETIGPRLGRGGMAWVLLVSPEYRADVVFLDYENELGRGETAPPGVRFPGLFARPAPTAAEINAWVFSGLDLYTIDEIFASSQEFFDRAD